MDLALKELVDSPVKQEFISIKEEVLPTTSEDNSTIKQFKTEREDEYNYLNPGTMESNVISEVVKCKDFKINDSAVVLPNQQNVDNKIDSQTLEIKDEHLNLESSILSNIKKEVDDIAVNSELISEVSDIPLVNEKEFLIDVSELDNIVLKTELLNEECDIPTVKREVDFSEGSSSMQLQQRIKKRMIKIVKIRRKYSCPVCCKSYVDVVSRNKHFRRHFGKSNIICFICGNIVRKRELFIKHIFKHITNRCTTVKKNLKVYFKCEVCRKLFTNKLNLTRHIKTQIKENNQKVCYYYKYKKIKAKRKSFGRVADEKPRPFQCDFCLKSFGSKSCLTRHLKVHTGEKPFECEICLNRFTQRPSLVSHMRLHTGEKPFECEVCHNRFTQRSSLMFHMKIHKGGKQYKCDICSKQFTQNIYLTRHLKLHSGDRPYKCDICSKEFSLRSYLNAHAKVHAGHKPFECEICSMHFNSKIILINHLFVHTGEKPFKCDICSKQYARKFMLEEHVRVHTGEKPFTCEICGKQFTHRNTFVKHSKGHKLGTQFKCDFCSKHFIRKNNFVEHLRVHTGEKPFKCEICSKEFSHKTTFLKHVVGHEKNSQL